MKKCPHCHTPVPDEAAHCPECGTALHETEENEDLRPDAGSKSMRFAPLLLVLVMFCLIVGAVLCVLKIASGSLKEKQPASSAAEQSVSEAAPEVTAEPPAHETAPEEPQTEPQTEETQPTEPPQTEPLTTEPAPAETEPPVSSEEVPAETVPAPETPADAVSVQDYAYETDVFGNTVLTVHLLYQNNGTAAAAWFGQYIAAAEQNGADCQSTVMDFGAVQNDTRQVEAGGSITITKSFIVQPGPDVRFRVTTFGFDSQTVVDQVIPHA